MTTRFPEMGCLRCGALMDAASHLTDDDATPEPGDVTICLYCGMLMAFSEDLTFRELTEEEITKVPLDEVSRFQRARKAAMNPWPEDSTYCETCEEYAVINLEGVMTCLNCNKNVIGVAVGPMEKIQ